MLIDEGSLTRAARVQRRRGFTLAEVLLALVLGAIVLGLASAMGTRLQRQLSREGARLAMGEQLAVAGAVLSPDLRALSVMSMLAQRTILRATPGSGWLIWHATTSTVS